MGSGGDDWSKMLTAACYHAHRDSAKRVNLLVSLYFNWMALLAKMVMQKRPGRLRVTCPNFAPLLPPSPAERQRSRSCDAKRNSTLRGELRQFFDWVRKHTNGYGGMSIKLYDQWRAWLQKKLPTHNQVGQQNPPRPAASVPPLS